MWNPRVEERGGGGVLGLLRHRIRGGLDVRAEGMGRVPLREGRYHPVARGGFGERPDHVLWSPLGLDRRGVQAFSDLRFPLRRVRGSGLHIALFHQAAPEAKHLSVYGVVDVDGPRVVLHAEQFGPGLPEVGRDVPTSVEVEEGVVHFGVSRMKLGRVGRQLRISGGRREPVLLEDVGPVHETQGADVLRYRVDLAGALDQNPKPQG